MTHLEARRPPAPCPCGIDVPQPWRTRNDIWSPASFIGGLVVTAFGATVGILADLRPWIGWIVLGLVGLSVLVSWIVQLQRRHRGWCLLRRGLWFGLSTPGAPIRLLATGP